MRVSVFARSAVTCNSRGKRDRLLSRVIAQLEVWMRGTLLEFKMYLYLSQ